MGIKFHRMTHGVGDSKETWVGFLEATSKHFQKFMPHSLNFDSARSWTLTFTNSHDPWYRTELH